MKVFKFHEYIKEGNTPEDFIDTTLQNIKNKLELDLNKSDEFELKILSSNISKYNPNEHTYKLKFTDTGDNMYILTAMIKLEDALNSDKTKDYKLEDLKKVHITFDKYGDNDENEYTIVDRLLDRTIEPKKIDGDYLVKLKIELDNIRTKKGGEEEFKIKTK